MATKGSMFCRGSRFRNALSLALWENVVDHAKARGSLISGSHAKTLKDLRGDWDENEFIYVFSFQIVTQHAIAYHDRKNLVLVLVEGGARVVGFVAKVLLKVRDEGKCGYDVSSVPFKKLERMSTFHKLRWELNDNFFGP